MFLPCLARPRICSCSSDRLDVNFNTEVTWSGLLGSGMKSSVNGSTWTDTVGRVSASEVFWERRGSEANSQYWLNYGKDSNIRTIEGTIEIDPCVRSLFSNKALMESPWPTKDSFRALSVCQLSSHMCLTLSTHLRPAIIDPGSFAPLSNGVKF